MVSMRELLIHVRGNGDGQTNVDDGSTVRTWLSNRFVFAGDITSMITKDKP